MSNFATLTEGIDRWHDRSRDVNIEAEMSTLICNQEKYNFLTANEINTSAPLLPTLAAASVKATQLINVSCFRAFTPRFSVEVIVLCDLVASLNHDIHLSRPIASKSLINIKSRKMLGNCYW